MNKLQITVFIAGTFLALSCGNGKANQTAGDTTVTNTTIAAGSQKKTILIFGDSITAGYGLDDPNTDSYPAVIQDKIDSAKLPYHVINGGLSGETSAGGKARINWLLQQKIDVFVLELGANDGLRGIPTQDMEKNLQAIIDKVKTRYPSAKMVLTGMLTPPNMGSDYAKAFASVFPAIAKKNNMAYVPFLLQNVAGIRQLNQGDGIHPTPQGAKIVAQNVWTVLKTVL
jgi:acyl-CoA thioesterase-1